MDRGGQGMRRILIYDYDLIFSEKNLYFYMITGLKYEKQICLNFLKSIKHLYLFCQYYINVWICTGEGSKQSWIGFGRGLFVYNSFNINICLLSVLGRNSNS